MQPRGLWSLVARCSFPCRMCFQNGLVFCCLLDWGLRLGGCSKFAFLDFHFFFSFRLRFVPAVGII